jgi:3-oxoacyl-[acyl-carrier protein] reductase
MVGVALVSGGSRGLGEAIVADLLDAGYAVASFSRHESPFVRDRRRADPAGDRFLFDIVDGRDVAAVRAFVGRVMSRFGRVDVLINNAAAAAEGTLPLLHADVVHDMIALNLEGAIALTQACVRAMLVGNRGGIIVNVSSIVGSRGYRGLSVYSATKAALDGLSRSLARELGPRQIRVNSIAPGFLDTDMSAPLDDAERHQIVRRTPLGRLGRTQDVLGVVRFLLSPAGAFITGQTLIVDGGITC